MSVIKRKPFIEKVLASMNATELNELQNQLNIDGNDIPNKLISEIPIGINTFLVKLNEFLVLPCICIRNATYSVALGYGDNQSISIYNLNINRGTYTKIKEYLTISEIRRVLSETVIGNSGSKITRLQYDDDVLGAPNNAKVTQFVKDSGYENEDSWGNIIVIIKTTQVSWTYRQISTAPIRKEWVGGGTDIVSPFSNTRQGTIIGDSHDGYVEHLPGDSDGFGHVHGFENKVSIMDAPTSTTLTPEERAKITGGVFMRGTFLSMQNPVFFPASDDGNRIYGMVIGKTGDTTVFGEYTISAANVIGIHIPSGDTKRYWLSMNNSREIDLTNIKTPTKDTDAANKKYVDDETAKYLPLDGSKAMTGNINMAGHLINMVGGRITNVKTPTSGTDVKDVANVEYVNTMVTNKLDKKKAESTDDNTHLYGYDKTVSDKSILTSILAVGDTVPLRDGVGCVFVADATANKHAVNLEQLTAAKTALDERINNIESIGRSLSGWNSLTGTAATNPPGYPTTAYPFKAGDYYTVQVCDSASDYPDFSETVHYAVGDKCKRNGIYYICKQPAYGIFDYSKFEEHNIINYKPYGTQYSDVPSTVLETGDVSVNDVYRYDGAGNWILYHYTSGNYIAAHDGKGTGTTNLENAIISGDLTLKVGSDLNVNGDATFTGEVNVPTPTSGNRAVNKTYADGLVTGTNDGTNWTSITIKNVKRNIKIGYDPDGESIIKNSDNKLAVSYGGKYIEQRAMFINDFTPGLHDDDNIYYIISVGATTINKIQEGDRCVGTYTIEGVEYSVDQIAQELTVVGMDTGVSYTGPGFVLFYDAAAHENVYILYCFGDFVLARENTDVSSLLTDITSLKLSTLVVDKANIRPEVLPLSNAFYHITTTGVITPILDTLINRTSTNAPTTKAVGEALKTITDLISTSASSTNKLLSASEIDQKIALVEANQLYKTNTQGSFATKAELTEATKFYDAAGNEVTPTKNDVVYVLADETHDNKTAKYEFVSKSGTTITWGFVIAFSAIELTQAQLDALNSGITSTKVAKIDEIAADLAEEATARSGADEELAQGISTVDGKLGNYLPLTGGIMLGTIKFATYEAIDSAGLDTAMLTFQNENGGKLGLRGVNMTENPGGFRLSANNGTNEKILEGYVNGNLKWNDYDVITSNGGTMTGEIVSNLIVPLRKNDTTGYMKIGVGTEANLGNAPSLRVYGTSHATYPGAFMCEANNGSGTQWLLLGKPDGTLNWGGNAVLRRKYIGGNLITGITNGTINTGVSYAIDMGGGMYYLSLLLSNVTLVRGETKIATTFQINGVTIKSISCLTGNANSSGTFLPATAVVWSGGFWITHYEAGTGEVRLSGIVNA